MDFLGLQDRTYLVTGVANKKSVAYHIGRLLSSQGATVVYAVRSAERRDKVASLLNGHDVLVCDVEREDEIARLHDDLSAKHPTIHGLVHSIAFADYEGSVKPFHETSKQQFLRAVDISCFSLVSLSNALRGLFANDAANVTISISTTRMASESYGFMAPIKAALDSSLVFLAKSFSRFSHVRFNAVAPGLLKTSASAGIPGYVDAYLYAEQVIPRQQAVTTDEVANVAAFLLSPRSSGINAQSIVIDAAMSINYFDQNIIQQTMNK